MRTTVELPTDLMRSAKARAGARGESLRTLFTRAVQLELGRGGPVEAAQGGHVDLPLFGDPQGPAVRMRGADVARFLATDEAARVTPRKRLPKR